MTMTVEGGVPLAELARVMKATVPEVEAECRALSVFVGTDWAGRPAVLERDASRLVDGSERRDQEHRREWLAHLAQSEQWTRDRDAVQQSAHDAAWREAGGPRGGQFASEAGRQAARTAAEAFERTHPVPTVGGQQTAQSWFRTVADKLAGAPR
jgi:hypothetical protein